ncbi:hypothetical protein SAMN05421846_11423 [Chryseobacterium taeanense]|uniref:Uncharacterized protein n=1 Tax=Chryseobacterium taeanense TaxID=311334 RepID=A0A1G8NLZ5_9FLAO|nr:hypothetical protein SAMN05421846_11423 [Chryseobacterium taeanense]
MAEVTRNHQGTTNLKHSHSQTLKPFNLHLTFVILNVTKRSEESLAVINAMLARTFTIHIFFSSAKALCSANDSNS